MKCIMCGSKNIRYVEIRVVKTSYVIQGKFEDKLEVMKEKDDVVCSAQNESCFECLDCKSDWFLEDTMDISLFEEVSDDERV